jgi:hypothetical protein
VNGKLVAASQNLHREFLLNLGQIAIIFAAKVDQQAIVRKLDKALAEGFGRGRRGQNTCGQSILLHMRVYDLSVPSRAPGRKP